MALQRRTRPLVGYGLDNSLQNLAPQPIVANRAPTASDTAEIGTEWVWPATNQVWILTSIANGSATWSSPSGGAGTFCDLTVTGTCGATNIQGGAFGVTIDSNTGTDIDIGTTNSAAIGIGSGGSTQVVTLYADGINLFASNAGEVLLSTTGGSFVVQGTPVVNIATDAAANSVTIGSLNTTSSTAIHSGTGAISLATGATTPGLVGVTPNAPTAASPTADVTANSRVISATFTGFTTANGAYQTFVINSSHILATSAIFATVYNLDASGNHAALQIAAMNIVVGSANISCLNAGLGGSGGALGTGDTVFVNVWVLN